jgi:serine/threonine-protein kinase ULK2
LSLQRPARTAVAIKVVTRSKLTPKLLENLEGEIAILRAISHPNIVELNDCIKTDSHIYLVMAFCAWGDLSMYIKSGGQLPGRPEDPIYNSKDLSASILPVSSRASSRDGSLLESSTNSALALRALWDEVAQFQHPADGGLHDLIVRSFLFQLSAALEFMRGKNIVHRDIKPQVSNAIFLLVVEPSS